jgi:hypothetical protein
MFALDLFHYFTGLIFKFYQKEISEKLLLSYLNGNSYLLLTISNINCAEQYRTFSCKWIFEEQKELTNSISQIRSYAFNKMFIRARRSYISITYLLSIFKSFSQWSVPEYLLRLTIFLRSEFFIKFYIMCFLRISYILHF